MDNSEIPVHTDANSKQKELCTTMSPRTWNKSCVEELSGSCLRCPSPLPLCPAAVPRRWSAGWRTSEWPLTWRSRAAAPTPTCCHPPTTVSPPCLRFPQSREVVFACPSGKEPKCFSCITSTDLSRTPQSGHFWLNS